MENIAKLLKEEIIKLVSEENINTVKLNEYLRAYENFERLKRFETSSVEEATLFPMSDNHQMSFGAVPRGYNNVRPYDNLGSMLDIFKEIAYDFNKPNRTEIDEYIYWSRWLDEIEDFIGYDNLKDNVSGLKSKLYERAIELMSIKLDDNIAKEKAEKIKTSDTMNISEVRENIF